MKYVLGTKSGCDHKGREIEAVFKPDTMDAKMAKTALGATCQITMTKDGGMTAMSFFAGSANNLVGFTCAGSATDAGAREECKLILATWKNE